MQASSYLFPGVENRYFNEATDACFKFPLIEYVDKLGIGSVCMLPLAAAMVRCSICNSTGRLANAGCPACRPADEVVVPIQQEPAPPALQPAQETTSAELPAAEDRHGLPRWWPARSAF